jgi:putative ABC transport system substrate-binding protein
MQLRTRSWQFVRRVMLGGTVGLFVAACGGGGAATSPSAPALTSPSAPVATVAPTIAKVHKICYNQFITVSVITEETKGMQGAFPGLGLVEGQNAKLIIQNPEGDSATNQTIAQGFIDQGCDILVGSATPGAQALAKASKTVPIVFIGVSNPVEAGLVKSLDAPGGNVTGVADRLPVELETDAMIQIKPGIKTIGLIWTTGDTAGEAHVARARNHITSLGLTFVEAPITNSADAIQSAQSLAGRVDAIQLPCDAPTLSAVPAIVKVADDAKIPVYGCSGEAVANGAILAGDYDYIKVGESAAKLVAQILLDGKDPGAIPVVVPTLLGFTLNKTHATLLGLTIPADLLAKAPKTY